MTTAAERTEYALAQLQSDMHENKRNWAESLERAKRQSYAIGWKSGIQHHINTAPKHWYERPEVKGTLIFLMLIIVPLSLETVFHHGKRRPLRPQEEGLDHRTEYSWAGRPQYKAGEQYRVSAR